MFVYERDGKICIAFDSNKPVETPDVVIEKTDADKIVLHVGDTEVEGDAQPED